MDESKPPEQDAIRLPAVTDELGAQIIEAARQRCHDLEVVMDLEVCRVISLVLSVAGMTHWQFSGRPALKIRVIERVPCAVFTLDGSSIDLELDDDLRTKVEGVLNNHIVTCDTRYIIG